MEDTPGWEKHKCTLSLSDPYTFDLSKIKPLPPKTFLTRLTSLLLTIRKDIHCLSATPNSIYHAWLLLWPFPWRLRVPRPLSVDELRERRDFVGWCKTYEVDYTCLRKVSLFLARDTLLRSIYRLYEAICSNCPNEVMEEADYIFNQQPTWKLEDIPDPKDQDPVRQAVLASIAETLVQAFNFKIGIGLRRGITNTKSYLIERFAREPDPPYEKVPKWPSLVGPLPDLLKMAPELVGAPKYFKKRNIYANVRTLWNV